MLEIVDSLEEKSIFDYGMIAQLPVQPSFREEDRYYFNARFYDATIGRFITIDPIQDGLNWYVYCNNRPLTMVDPTGLRAVFDEDINGNSILVHPNGDLDVSVEIVRGAGDEPFNDNFDVKVNGQVYNRDKVHAEKFLESNNGIDFTLPEGDDYELELLEKSGSFLKPLRITSPTAQGPVPLSPGVKTSDAFLVHPNEITNPVMREYRESRGYSNGPWAESKPQGLGCIIFKNAAVYSNMRSGLEALGKNNGDKIPMEISKEND